METLLLDHHQPIIILFPTIFFGLVKISVKPVERVLGQVQTNCVVPHCVPHFQTMYHMYHTLWYISHVVSNFQLNLTTLEFRVGYGCGRWIVFQHSRPSFSNSSLNFWYWYQFSAQLDDIEILLGMVKAWSRDPFLNLGTFIFKFLVQFWVLVSILSSIG